MAGRVPAPGTRRVRLLAAPPRVASGISAPPRNYL